MQRAVAPFGAFAVFLELLARGFDAPALEAEATGMPKTVVGCLACCTFFFLVGFALATLVLLAFDDFLATFPERFALEAARDFAAAFGRAEEARAAGAG